MNAEVRFLAPCTTPSAPTHGQTQSWLHIAYTQLDLAPWRFCLTDRDGATSLYTLTLPPTSQPLTHVYTVRLATFPSEPQQP